MENQKHNQNQDANQSNESLVPRAEKQKMKTSYKVIIGVSAAFFLIAVIAVTAVVTAFMVMRSDMFRDDDRRHAGNGRNVGNNWQQEYSPRHDEGNQQQTTTLPTAPDNQQQESPPQESPPQDAPPQETPQDANVQDSTGMFDHVVPRAPQRQGGPENPPISAIRAVELAHDYLLSIGVTDARFEYVYMDREDGFWVWSVEFDGRGDRDYEFYVDVETGDFIEAPRSRSGHRNLNFRNANLRNWHNECTLAHCRNFIR